MTESAAARFRSGTEQTNDLSSLEQVYGLLRSGLLRNETKRVTSVEYFCSGIRLSHTKRRYATCADCARKAELHVQHDLRRTDADPTIVRGRRNKHIADMREEMSQLS